MPVTLTNKAKADLKEIGHYTQDHWGRDQRNEYLTMLDACFQLLAANPLRGQNHIKAQHFTNLNHIAILLIVEP